GQQRHSTSPSPNATTAALASHTMKTSDESAKPQASKETLRSNQLSRYRARRLHKSLKCQSKYTLLLDLMDSSSFQRFLMDKVNYFLRRLRAEKLRRAVQVIKHTSPLVSSAEPQQSQQPQQQALG